jgi:N-acetylglucosaminyldiphosphoundecaprenol N-acetyl-beta-D-mannosaminyltransferase
MSGFKRRAPKFYQKIGFEWLYRLFHEPKRLWKRYLLGIPIFIYQILLFKLKLIVKAKN